MVLYALVVIGLLSYALADLFRTPASAVRTLPKPLWFLVVLPPLFGPLAWLLVGRPKSGAGRAAESGPPARPLSPDDDEDFLRELRRRSRDPRDDAA